MPEPRKPPLRRIAAALRDIVRGAAGTDAYERYCAHVARRHAGEAPLSRAAFFASDQAARWDGVRRCC